MASPIDTALLATQTYKLRKPASGPKPRAPEAGTPERPDIPSAPNRRSQPAVSLSLSAEALELLSGNRQPAREPQPALREDRQPAAQSVEAAGSADAVFDPVEPAAPPRREAPFAHLPRESAQRATLPGSRLDISV